MPVFGASPGQDDLPVSHIKTMRSQGMDNNQIIQTLQREGYSSAKIFEAMNQADMEPGSDQGSSPPSPEGMSTSGGFGSSPGGGQMPSPPSQQSSYSTGDFSTEELVEAIIDEKWNILVKDVKKIVEWKNAANNKIVSLEQKFDDLKQEFDKLHSAIISKIDDYDKNITNVGAEVRAMEKVFSKVLPVFTENVSELSRISKEFKKGSDSKKQK